jgi:hypothetical protein
MFKRLHRNAHELVQQFAKRAAHGTIYTAADKKLSTIALRKGVNRKAAS